MTTAPRLVHGAPHPYVADHLRGVVGQRLEARARVGRAVSVR
jgi:hypothetical protein